MKAIIVLSAVFFAVCAAREYEQAYHNTSPIPIVKSDSQLNHDGSYQFAYETGHGIQVHEQGYVKNQGVKDGEVQVAQGYYSYTGPDGHPVAVNYVADENGFQASGAHLPTPPPLPKELVDAIAEHAAHPHHYQQEEEPQPAHYNQHNYKNKY